MDLYTLLGLTPEATTGDIKRAYRRLARKYHPDINPGDRAAEVRFRQIQEAYEILTDPERRRAYDQAGRVEARSDGASYGFEGFDFSVEASFGPGASTFGDLFGGVFRRAAAGRPGDGAEQGADLYATAALSFGEAMRGAERPVTVTRGDRCAACHGAGLVRGSDGPCLRCDGSGTLRTARGHMVFSRPCEACGGVGRQPPRACPRCGGLGVETRAETVTVRLPPGIADGARIRVPGKGNAGLRGGPAGDLYVAVSVAADPVFRREGDDLHVQVPVAVHEAALGARIEVPTVDGPASLRVPPGMQSGQRLRLRGRGAPSPRDGRRGDLVVELRVVLPRVLDERSKELLREFGRINRENVREGAW
jgi:molecular chaperone DnaJ